MSEDVSWPAGSDEASSSKQDLHVDPQIVPEYAYSPVPLTSTCLSRHADISTPVHPDCEASDPPASTSMIKYQKMEYAQFHCTFVHMSLLPPVGVKHSLITSEKLNLCLDMIFIGAHVCRKQEVTCFQKEATKKAGY